MNKTTQNKKKKSWYSLLLKQQRKCIHDWYNVGLNTGIITGRRCRKCSKQEWF